VRAGGFIRERPLELAQGLGEARPSHGLTLHLVPC
jgi:hypothetical protein